MFHAASLVTSTAGGQVLLGHLGMGTNTVLSCLVLRCVITGHCSGGGHGIASKRSHCFVGTPVIAQGRVSTSGGPVTPDAAPASRSRSVDLGMLGTMNLGFASRQMFTAKRNLSLSYMNE